ncbi:hypothetical protein P171DRAFT_431089 [Karstenula rhodostoma CBS 690.94]|uniref:Uncharacterized protein n=1 Tax=Karstenula rhodostoma CBS 690.94 TaxID=1392251 RepID=A0A9P4PLW4_9PLEO|nr:hypothetical protein P171DRAFT_431089 [Karstenula rhodostoma CBS 690.94]
MSGQIPHDSNQPPQYGSDNQNPYSNPWGSESQAQNPAQSYGQPTQTQDRNPFHAQDQPQNHNPFAQEQSYNPSSEPPPGQNSEQYTPPPGLPPRRIGTTSEQALPQGQDRSHQVEVMQSYEMSRPQTEDEQNQAILGREFPKIDGSLIAAIYGDSGSLSATREMLQELSSTEGQGS